MKRVLAAVLALSLSIFLVSCNNDDDDDDVSVSAGVGDNLSTVSYDTSGSEAAGVMCWDASDAVRIGTTNYCTWNCTHYGYQQFTKVTLRFDYGDAPLDNNGDPLGGVGWWLVDVHYEPGICN